MYQKWENQGVKLFRKASHKLWEGIGSPRRDATNCGKTSKDLESMPQSVGRHREFPTRCHNLWESTGNDLF